MNDPPPTLDPAMDAVLDLLTIDFPLITERNGPHFAEAIVRLVQRDRHRSASQSALASSGRSKIRRCEKTRDVFDHPIVKGVRCTRDGGHEGNCCFEHVEARNREAMGRRW